MTAIFRYTSKLVRRPRAFIPTNCQYQDLLLDVLWKTLSRLHTRQISALQMPRTLRHRRWPETEGLRTTGK